MTIKTTENPKLKSLRINLLHNLFLKIHFELGEALSRSMFSINNTKLLNCQPTNTILHRYYIFAWVPTSGIHFYN